MINFSDIAVRDSALVKRGIALHCGICKAKPDQPCTNTIRPGRPLPGREIHIERATRPARDTEPIEKDGT